MGEQTMQAIRCERCGSGDLAEREGLFVCRCCGAEYAPEEAKGMLPEGVRGTDMEETLKYARKALNREDWEEAEKYYHMAEQNAPYNMEAAFFSSYGKVMLSMRDSDFSERERRFAALNNTISVLGEYYERTSENKENVLFGICYYIGKLFEAGSCVYSTDVGHRAVGSLSWCRKLIESTANAFAAELKQIAQKHDDAYMQELIKKSKAYKFNSGCYIATAVYDSYDCPQVWTLRRYRDDTLAKTWYGRAFIRLYYAVSPTLVKWFGATEWVKRLWKCGLDRMVEDLNACGVKNTSYEDRRR